ncbi:hypothetical protein HaLaN_27114 [Haematococcus lacustris]|uniref:Uncharacterized protein n=1 Tax=Haematococcus lacustris TaxID=44745 RepID=A0A6A0A924_HAELA|nr:hypothetical protein HaLaN_27114 [Haematococcus lacustris]
MQPTCPQSFLHALPARNTGAHHSNLLLVIDVEGNELQGQRSTRWMAMTPALCSFQLLPDDQTPHPP